MFWVNDKGLERLEDRYKYSLKSPRIEYAFKSILKEFFKNIKINEQEQFDKYKVDFYFPEFKLVVEYDEKEHNQRVQEDLIRQNEILDTFNSSVEHFIRVKEGCEVEGIRDILRYIASKDIYLFRESLVS